MPRVEISIEFFAGSKIWRNPPIKDYRLKISLLIPLVSCDRSKVQLEE